MADHPQPAARRLRPDDRDWIEPRLRAIGERLGPNCPADLSFTNIMLFDSVHHSQVVKGTWPAGARVRRAVDCAAGRSCPAHFSLTPLK